MTAGEFRARDGILAGYYFLYLTANWLLLAALGEDGAAAVGVAVGILSMTVVAVTQADRTSDAKFNPLCFATYLSLMCSVVAADLLIAAW